MRYAIILMLIVAAVGCDSMPGGAARRELQLVWLPDQPQPVPVADIPFERRVHNWIGTDVTGHTGGSCCHASVLHCFRAAGRTDLEQYWYDRRDQGFEGPEAAFRVMDKMDGAGIPFIATEDGDVRVLEMATETHRPAVIFYYPGHAINFIEFAELDGRQVAILLDNNFEDSYIVVDRTTFLDSWINGYGGFALVPWIEPTVPRTFPRTMPRR